MQKSRSKISKKVVFYLLLLIPFMIVLAQTLDKIPQVKTPWANMLIQAFVLALIIKGWLNLVHGHTDFFHYLEFEKKIWQKLGLGCLFGIIAALIVVIVERLLGSSLRVFNQELLGLGLIKVLFIAVVFFIAEAFIEEMVTRGYVLEQFMEIGAIPMALFSSSLAFVLVQFLWDNPNVSILGWLNFFALAFLLGLLYLLTLSKWFCIGFHAAWNLVFTVIFPPLDHHGGHFASYLHMESMITTVFLLVLIGISYSLYSKKRENTQVKIA